MLHKITASIVTYNNQDVIGETLSSIFQHTKDVDFTLYVSDNNSTDATVRMVKEKFPSVIVIENEENRGFGWAHNQVIKQISDSDYHVIINPDIRLPSNVFYELASFMESNSEVVLATPKIINEDGSEQHLPKRLPKLKYLFGGRFERFGKPFSTWRDEYTRRYEAFDEPEEIQFCTGCFMFARTEALKKVGGFDERYFLYFEDVDLAREMAFLGKVVFVPQVEVIHLWERASAKKMKMFLIQIRSMLQFFMKWSKRKE